MNNIKNISFSKPKSWYFENGYLTIDLELFGKYLCAIFNEYLEGYYYFQKFTPIIATDKERPIWQQGEERKKLAIISPILYKDDSDQNYNRARVINTSYPRSQYLQPLTLSSKEQPSLFSKAPLKLAENEFLLYFGDYDFDNVKICLGYIENNQFIPTNAFETSKTTGIEHLNPKYSFVEDFITAIFYYKILNKKPILNQRDMELILEKFGINRTEKIQAITELLKFVQEESTAILLRNHNVGRVLKLKK